MIKRNGFFLIGVALLCLWSCKDYDDGMPARKYEFSNNQIIVSNEATDLEVKVMNAGELSLDWNIINAQVTDDIRTDSIIENERIGELETYPSILQWEWFCIQKTNEGKTFKVHVDANTGGDRSLVMFMGAFMDYGFFTLKQEGTK